MVSGLKYTVLIIILVCVDEGLQETCDGGLSASDVFAQSFRVSSIVQSDHSNCSHQAQLTASLSLRVQKENILADSAR